MHWYNEPPDWHLEDDTITVTTGRDTDFWRVTHYDFIRDNGHFYHQAAQGDFTAEVEVRGAYRHLYDQGGMMLRLDETCWIKAGIELSDGKQQLSAVVTRDYSDWSLLQLPEQPEAVWLRVTRHGTAIRIEYSLDGTHFEMFRLAYLPWRESIDVGVMCCSPQSADLEVSFTGFEVRAAIPRMLHD
jgi:regulation of enolase protein 1 (concanavalin A-like superfamily)